MSGADITITHEERQDGGRYIARLDDSDQQAQLTYRHAGDNIVVANHTGVPDAMGGRGIGTALLRHFIADARRRGLKIIPQCSFVHAQAIKHPEWADIIVM